jgi:hypothetical protein
MLTPFSSKIRVRSARTLSLSRALAPALAEMMIFTGVEDTIDSSNANSLRYCHVYFPKTASK